MAHKKGRRPSRDGATDIVKWLVILALTQAVSREEVVLLAHLGKGGLL